MLTALFLLLFAVAIFALISGKHMVYGLLFTAFTLNGFFLLPASSGSIKLTHLSFGFSVIFCLYHIQSVLSLLRTDPRVRKLIWLLFFFVCSIGFSIIHYNFPVVDTIQTGLRYFTLLSFFIYIQISQQEYVRLLRILFYITFFTAIFYIIQCITGQPLMFSHVESYNVPMENGLFRFYNAPPLIGVFILISIFFRQYIPKQFRLIAPIIFILPVLLSNGRGAILTISLQIALVMISLGLRRKYIIGILIVGGIFFSIQDLIFTRMDNDGKTSEDISYTLKGEFDRSGYQSEGGYTFLYRIAWINERWEYLSERPINEKLFGLGLLPDEHPIIKQKYNFLYGLLMPDSNLVAQIRTPDIAWGNFLTCYGLLGTTIFFIFYFSLLIHLWRTKHPFARMLAVYMISQLISSFTGISISEPYNLSILFLFYGYFRKIHLPQVC